MLFLTLVSAAQAWDTGPEGWSDTIQWCADSAIRDDVADAWAVWQSVSTCTVIDVVEVSDCADADIAFSTGESPSGTCRPNESCALTVPGPDFFPTDCPEISVEAFLLQNIGFALGLDHSCSEGEPCEGDGLVNAIMHWSRVSTCEAVVPTADDFEGLSSLYGPGAVENPPADVVVASVGEEVCFTAEVTDAALDVEFAWSMGDGTALSGQTVCHTYSEALEGAVSLEASYPSCGWERSHTPWQSITIEGDEAEEEESVDSGEASKDDSGCSTVGGAAGGLFGVLAGLLALTRRRQR